MKHFSLSTIAGLTLGIGLIAYSAFAWAPPQQTPPDANVPAPLNTTSTAQEKLGELTVGGLNVGGVLSAHGGIWSDGGLVVQGGVRIGSFTSRPTCAASNIGTIIWDNTENKLYVCTNAGWAWATLTIPALATAPGAPTGVNATAGDGRATVSWSAPADGGSPIIRYTTTSNPGGVSVSTLSSPATVTGLTNGTSITFTVTATNAIGIGPASAPSNAVTPAPALPPPPAQPTGLTATPVSRTQINLSWNASSGATSYKVYRCTGSGCDPALLVDVGNTTTYQNVGLSCGQTFTYNVAAFNGGGGSGFTTVSNVSASTQACAGAVYNLTVHAFFDSNLDGVQNTGPGVVETNVINGQIRLTQDFGARYTTTQVTDSSGNTTFVLSGSQLGSGRYWVTLLSQAGAQIDSQGYVNLTGDAGNSTFTLQVTSRFDFIVHAFSDNNGNNVQDAGEPNISGGQIELEQSSRLIMTQTTDSSGNTTFVVSGSIYIRAGYRMTLLVRPGYYYGNTTTVSLSGPPGGGSDIFNLAARPRYDLTVHAFLDDNFNRVQDAGEPNISGGQIELTQSFAPYYDTIQTTDSFGNTTFVLSGSQLAAGIYQLALFNQLAYAGDWDSLYLPGDAGSMTYNMMGMTLRHNTIVHVFSDNNNNRVYDAPDSHYQGAEVTLRRNAGAGLIGLLLSDINGEAVFRGTNFGEYWLTVMPGNFSYVYNVNDSDPRDITIQVPIPPAR